MRNTWNSCGWLFDPFGVESVCAPVTPGCTRGYSHSCPSGTVRHQGRFRTRGDRKPECRQASGPESPGKIPDSAARVVSGDQTVVKRTSELASLGQGAEGHTGEGESVMEKPKPEIRNPKETRSPKSEEE